MWGRLRLRPAHPGGLVLGVACAMAAMTPSLLPRDWLYQGLVSGICGAAGYGVGVALAWVLRHVPPWRRLLARVRGRVPDQVVPRLWPTLLVTLAPALVLMLVVGARWQRGMTAAIGMPPPSTADWLRAGPLLVAVAAALVLAARVVRWAVRRVDRTLEDRLGWPHAVAGVVATVVVLAGIVLVDDALLRRALVATDVAFAARNDEDHPGVARPTAPERSGSPDSAVPWETLGREGRRFVATGPTAAQLRSATADGAPTTVPIRVYAGIESAPTPDERAALAVEELERTGAFERSVLLVATATGSGWVNGPAVAALEAVHGGDTATVATQYSYLPSWLSFLVDRSRAADEAQALTSAVESRLAALPVDERPRLLLYGESLGSYGSESVFTSLADVRARTDGVLWVGPPHANPLWHALMDRRDPGTPAAAPVYAGGLLVRFAGDREQIALPPTAWEPPRTLYLQHVDDPVVWWSPDLLLSEPDWLQEPAPTDRPTVRWFPLVTFWQLTFDLLNAKSVPDGHGHNYDALALDGWAAVAPPDGWTDVDTARVRAALEP